MAADISILEHCYILKLLYYFHMILWFLHTQCKLHNSHSLVADVMDLDYNFILHVQLHWFTEGRLCLCIDFLLITFCCILFTNSLLMEWLLELPVYLMAVFRVRWSMLGFSSTLSLLGRLLRVDLIKWVSNVRPSVCPSTESFFHFNEIWYVGRGRRVMNDGMQYDPIQGEGHEPLQVGNSAIFNGYLFPHL